MVQMREEELAAGKQAASTARKQAAKGELGEGDVDARLDRKKLDDVLKGKSSTFGGAPVTEEEMGRFCSLALDAGDGCRCRDSPCAEAYRMQRDQKFDDPMANLGKDELLPM